MMLRFVSGAATALLAVWLSQGAIAAPGTGGFVYVEGAVALSGGAYSVKRTAVRFEDLDIAAPQGAAALLGRLKTAAAVVCSVRGMSAYDAHSKAVERCRADAVSDAVGKLAAPELTRLAAGE
jgi:UrcA family protein